MVNIITNLRSQFKTLFGSNISVPESGLYHYRRENDAEKTRLHLRLDPDGSGLLWVNASRVYHLNPTAALITYLILEEHPQDKAIQLLTDQFDVPSDQASIDYAQIGEQLNLLAHPDDACPICDLDLETTLPFSARPSAPYRMDLAITYRCNNNCAHCYNARSRQFPELGTHEWKEVLDRIWELGIPHIVFTGGEPTLRPDLPELIGYAEELGLIAGLNTNGRRLKDADYLKSLVDAGLDHVQITLESHDSTIHDQMVVANGAWNDTVAGVKNALNSPLYVMTNTTLLQANTKNLADTLKFLASLGVPTIGLNALIYSGKGATVGTGLPESDLPPLLDLAREYTTQQNQRLIWYTPTEYCHFDPVQMELGVKGCTAALYNMCIEPDGSLLPCQSYYQSLGDFRKDSWDTLWNHDLAVQLRERKNLPEKCNACAVLQECGGGCPLTRKGQSDLV